MNRVVWCAMLGASVLSCSSATGPIATISATVTSVTTTAQGSLDAMLDVDLTNATSREIYLAPCGTSLERKNVEGGWDPVWSVVCLAVTTSMDPMVIPSGSTKTLTVRITAGNDTSWPSVSLDGNYRLRVHFFPSDDLIRRMSAVTNLISATPVVSNEFHF